MKTTGLLMLLATLILSSCVGRPPPAPGDKGLSWSQTSAYRRGYHDGFHDGKRGMDEDFERYHDEYKTDSAAVFERGYRLGYKAGHEEGVAGPQANDEAYNQGVELGQADYANALKPAYQRHPEAYNAGSESSFALGYSSGYKAARMQ